MLQAQTRKISQTPYSHLSHTHASAKLASAHKCRLRAYACDIHGAPFRHRVAHRSGTTRTNKKMCVLRSMFMYSAYHLVNIPQTDFSPCAARGGRLYHPSIRWTMCEGGLPFAASPPGVRVLHRCVPGECRTIPSLRARVQCS